MDYYKHNIDKLERDLEDAIEALSDNELPYDIDSVFNAAVNVIISEDYANHCTFNVESVVFDREPSLVALPAVFHMAITLSAAEANHLPPAVSNAYRCKSPNYVCAVASDYFGDVPMPLAAQGCTVNHAVLSSMLRYFLASLHSKGLT